MLPSPKFKCLVIARLHPESSSSPLCFLEIFNCNAKYMCYWRGHYLRRSVSLELLRSFSIFYLFFNCCGHFNCSIMRTLQSLLVVLLVITLSHSVSSYSAFVLSFIQVLILIGNCLASAAKLF